MVITMKNDTPDVFAPLTRDELIAHIEAYQPNWFHGWEGESRDEMLIDVQEWRDDGAVKTVRRWYQTNEVVAKINHPAVYVGSLDPATKGVRDWFKRIRDGINKLIPDLPDDPRYTDPMARARAEQQRNAKPSPPDDDRQEKVRKMLDTYRTEFQSKAKELAGQLADGEITPRQFRGLMITEIRHGIYTAVALARGGVGSMEPDDVSRVDEAVRKQAEYLDNWVAQIERTPKENLSKGQMQTRASMYGNSMGATTYETLDKQEYKQFPDLPFYPKDGTTDCMNGCKCHWSWRKMDEEKGDADVYWVLGVAEHCEQCAERAVKLNPLKIRNFQFQFTDFDQLSK